LDDDGEKQVISSYRVLFVGAVFRIIAVGAVHGTMAHWDDPWTLSTVLRLVRLLQSNKHV